MNTFQRRRFLVAFLLVLAIFGFGFGIHLVSKGPSLTPVQIALRAERARVAALKTKEHAKTQAAQRLVNVRLPTVEGSPAPVTPAKLFAHSMIEHQVVAFVPYWTLSSFTTSAAALESTDATVLVYSNVCVAGDGSIDTSPGECANGMNALLSPEFTAFVDVAHSYHDRVLLSVQTIDPAIIHALGTHPMARSSTLASAVLHLVNTYGLDGIDLDIEGRGPADRENYVNFVRDFSRNVRASSNKLELMADTYPQSAASSTDFYDVAKLAHYLDALFVMAYQMNNAHHSSANSPLASPTLAWSAVQTLIQYTAVVPANKIIFGMPFYGLNFTTRNANPGSQFIGNPGARLYNDIVAAARPAQWDIGSSTPFAVFQQDGQWHQDWFDDPVSIALKTALAQNFHLAGVGVWALSYQGADTQMLAALTGERPVIKLPLSRQHTPS